MNVAVIGAGSWGTALAQVLGGKGEQVTLWARRQEVADSINERHVNPSYLSDAVLSENVVATTSLEEALDGAEVVVMVSPSQNVREMCERMRGLVDADTPIVM